MPLKNKMNFDKFYYYATVVFAFSMPLSRAAISFFVILLPLMWILEGNYSKKYLQIKSNKVLLSVIGFIVFSCFSFFFSTNTELALNILRLNSYFILIFVIATSINKKNIHSILSAFLCGMFISEVIAYGVFFELWEFKNATVENPTPFMRHIEYSVFLAFTSILLLNRLFLKYYNFRNKLLIFLFFISVVGNLFLSKGRTGQVALIIGITVLMIIHFRISIKSILLSILLIIMIFFSAYQSSNTFKERLNKTIKEIDRIKNMDLRSSIGIRISYWIITKDVVINNFFGQGIGDYKLAIKEEVNQNKYKNIKIDKAYLPEHHPHNQYLLILLQMGFIGLFLFFYIMYNIFKLKIQNNDFKEISLIFLVIYFVSCLSEPLLIKQFSLSLFCLFVGLFSIYGVDDEN